MQNLKHTFDWHYMGQKYGGDFAKFYDLHRIYELKRFEVHMVDFVDTFSPLPNEN